MGGIASELVIQLPSKFAIPETDKFTSTEDPKQHLLQYLSFVKMEGIKWATSAICFPTVIIRNCDRMILHFGCREDQSLEGTYKLVHEKIRI